MKPNETQRKLIVMMRQFILDRAIGRYQDGDVVDDECILEVMRFNPSWARCMVNEDGSERVCRVRFLKGNKRTFWHVYSRNRKDVVGLSGAIRNMVMKRK
jgi:hypothetical protein